MNDKLTYVIGPETVLAALLAVIYWICARHSSGEGRDVEVLERLVMVLPLIVVPLAFATVFVPGAKTWWWLGRMLLASFAAMFLGSARIIEGFGTGAKGQDAAFFMVLGIGVILASLAAAIAGAMILAGLRPSFGEWFAARRTVGSILTLLAALPIGVALTVVVSLGVGTVAGLWSAFK